MAVPTVEITTNISYASGASAENVHVIAELQSPAQNSDGYIVQKIVKGIVDVNGDVTINLWPNDLGDTNSFYKITAYDEILGELLKVVTVVPDSIIPLELEDIAMPINGFSLANASGNVASIRRIDTLEGINGGGDLSTNRTHILDLNTISTEAINPALDWIIPIQDPGSVDGVRYIRLLDIPGIASDDYEYSIAVDGQTEILIEKQFVPDSNALDVYINGKHQCPTSYTEDTINDVVYNGRIILSEPMEDGDEICIKIKGLLSISNTGIDSGQVLYSGGGSVEDALNTLFSASGLSPWQEVNTDTTVNSGDRIFVSTNTGPVTITLPPTPSIGDSIQIVDTTSSVFTGIGNTLVNDITVDRNGNFIMELTENLIIDQAKVSLEFIYSGASVGWVFSE